MTAIEAAIASQPDTAERVRGGNIPAAGALIALGIALISPNVSSLISRRAGGRVGTALGIQNAANSLGQASGPLVGGLLFAWRIDAPYLLTAALLLVIATVIGWRVRTSHIALVTS